MPTPATSTARARIAPPISHGVRTRPPMLAMPPTPATGGDALRGTLVRIVSPGGTIGAVADPGPVPAPTPAAPTPPPAIAAPATAAGTTSPRLPSDPADPIGCAPVPRSGVARAPATAAATGGPAVPLGASSIPSIDDSYSDTDAKTGSPADAASARVAASPDTIDS